MNPKCLQKSSSFFKWVKTSAKNGAHFLDHFWIVELTHIVFELELLIPIKYLVAPNILKLGEGLWFKSDNAHKSLQNFIKCFSI